MSCSRGWKRLPQTRLLLPQSTSAPWRWERTRRNPLHQRVLPANDGGVLSTTCLHQMSLGVLMRTSRPGVTTESTATSASCGREHPAR